MAVRGRVLLAGQAYAQLRSAIIRGEIAPGERLTEAHVANSLGVSRTPVREALNRLESEGMVMRDGAGLIAMPRDPGAATEVLMMRELLEPFCVETSAPNLTGADLARLRSIVGEMEAAGKDAENRADTLAELNLEYHDVLHARCPYGRILDELRRNSDHFVTYWLFSVYTEADFAVSMEEHRKMQEVAVAVADGRAAADELAASVKAHIARARASFESRVREAES
jgi:DNA-binding GntR family transcriptional regulator